MFQQGPAICNVNRDTTSKSINANPMGTISYAININLKLVTINANPMGTISARMFQQGPAICNVNI